MRRVIDRDGRGSGVRDGEAAPGPAPEAPAEVAVLALQRSAGNGAVTRMLGGRAVLARTMTEPVTFASLSAGDVTPAVLRQMKATIDTAVVAMKADQIQASFADMSRVDTWLEQFDTTIAALLDEINLQAPPDPEVVGLPWSTVSARGSTLADRIWAVATTINNLRGHLNKAFDAHKKFAKEQAEAEQASQLAYEVPAEFKEKGKGRGAKTSMAAEGGESEGEEGEEGGVAFPHKGKHAPPPGAVGRPTVLMEITAEKGAAAIYSTRNPKTVIGWEQEARDGGWTLFDGKTVVHGFTNEVGADHGEMTRFVRIDGDHGHPIIEDHQSLNTSFTAYVKKEVREARTGQDTARLQRLFDYLTKIGFPPHRAGLRSRPADAAPAKELEKAEV